jgi:hypothetical protein
MPKETPLARARPLAHAHTSAHAHAHTRARLSGLAVHRVPRVPRWGTQARPGIASRRVLPRSPAVKLVPYALIGGVAVGIRSGVPRATLDVDFAVTSTADRDMLASALEARGVKRKGNFALSSNFVHRSGEPVQLAFDPGFDAMIARAEAVPVGALSVPVVTREDLIEMKRRAAADPTQRRSKALRDQADIALLEGDVEGPDEGW